MDGERLREGRRVEAFFFSAVYYLSFSGGEAAVCCFSESEERKEERKKGGQRSEGRARKGRVKEEETEWGEGGGPIRKVGEEEEKSLFPSPSVDT